jgi:hypothetical protein
MIYEIIFVLFVEVVTFVFFTVGNFNISAWERKHHIEVEGGRLS